MDGTGKRKEIGMYHFEYVSRKEAALYRDEFLDIIHEVQDFLRDKFTFSYDFIGSSARNMITCDYTTNKGFDFDVNLHINDDDEEFSAKEIKHVVMNAINKAARPKGFEFCEDSTRVITLKKLASYRNRIEYSCDFALVNDWEDKKGKKHQQYIRFQKEQGLYVWADQPDGYNLEKKVQWIKKHDLWEDVWDLYLDKKNYNDNPDKKSRSLYAETIHEVAQKNGYCH